MIDVKWLGVAGLEFTVEGKTYLIDPYLSRNSKKDIFFKTPHANLRRIDDYLSRLSGKLSAIMVGHTHLDHALDIPEFSKRFDGPVIGSESLKTLLELHQISDRVTVTAGNEEIPLSASISVTMIPSTHGLVLFNKVPYPGEIDRTCPVPMKAADYKHGQPFIPKLVIHDKTFMHMGSANFDADHIRGHHADVLFMCLPGWKKVPEYTESLLSILDPGIVVPFHFDDFSAPAGKNGTPKNLPLQDMKGFIKKIQETLPRAKIIIPEYFKPMTF